MKVNLERIHNPCQQCYMNGHLYSPEDNMCQRCEYAIAIEALHSVLTIIGSSGCAYCSKYKTGCAVPSKEECEWSIDWDAVVKNFNVGK